MTLRMSLLALLAGCSGDDFTTTNVSKDEGFEEEPDVDAPVIVHEEVVETQTFGVDVPIEATVTDEGSGVLFVYLKYKNEIDGSADWERAPMTTTGGGVYSGTIRGNSMRGGGVDYYIEAVDYAENFGFSPDDGAESPYHFRIAEGG